MNHTGVLLLVMYTLATTLTAVMYQPSAAIPAGTQRVAHGQVTATTPLWTPIWMSSCSLLLHGVAHGVCKHIMTCCHSQLVPAFSPDCLVAPCYPNQSPEQSQGVRRRPAHSQPVHEYTTGWALAQGMITCLQGDPVACGRSCPRFA